MKRMAFAALVFAVVFLAMGNLGTLSDVVGFGDEVEQAQTLIPDQFKLINAMLSTEDLVGYGTGYYAWVNGRVMAVTVGHVIRSEYLILDFPKHLQLVEGHRCHEGKIMADASCEVFQEKVSTSNIIRDVSFVPTEVSLYHPTLGVWMPFVVTGKVEDGFFAHGIDIDIDGDGLVDVLSEVCHGMSGSPLIESQLGVPVNDEEGRLIARGELSQMYTINEETGCSPEIFVINLGL